MVSDSGQQWRPLDNLALVRSHIQPALDAGSTHTFEDVILSVLKGDMQLWHTPKGSAVTEVINAPRKRIMHWFLAGGEMDQVLRFQDSIRIYARAIGCTEMTLSGRPGWVKVLRRHGWTQKGVLMGAEI